MQNLDNVFDHTLTRADTIPFITDIMKDCIAVYGQNSPMTKRAEYLKNKATSTSAKDAPEQEAGQAEKQSEDDAMLSYFALACFNPEALVLMSDGKTLKRACDVEVGDWLLSPDCEEGTCVRGRTVQPKETTWELVMIGDLLISSMHHVIHNGKWIPPISYPGAKWIKTSCQLHNFFVSDRVSIVVNGITMQTLGTYCEGIHDLTHSVHSFWASEIVVNVFATHPLWPNIELDLTDNIFAVTKNRKFLKEYMEKLNGANKEYLSKEETHEMLIKYGWQYTA